MSGRHAPEVPNLRSLAPLLIIALLASGCGPVLRRVTVASATEIFQDGMEAFYREGDLILAEQALASHLKFLEVFLQASPENETLLLQAAQAFGAYAFAFVEEKIEAHRGDREQTLLHTERARRLYLRGRDYGLKLLQLRSDPFAHALTADLPTFQAAVKRLQEEDVPALFWTAYGWAGYITWSRDRPEAVAGLPRVEAMMRRVLELNEGYFSAGPHLFFGVYYASRSRGLGGDPAQAKFHLDRALQLTAGKLLLVHLFTAYPYAVQTQDRRLFETMLQAILDAPEDLSPEQRLSNAIAKARAQLLHRRIDELFL